MQEVRKSCGYRLVYRPEHPQAYLGYVAEHRLVAEEQILKRPLKPGEVVLHRNGKRGDNRPENLQVLTRSQVSKIVGNRQGRTFGIFVCPYCETVFVREKRQSHLSKNTMGTFCSRICISRLGNQMSQGAIPAEVLTNLETNLVGLFIAKSYALPLREDFAEVFE